jgi:hypothetical protein
LKEEEIRVGHLLRGELLRVVPLIPGPSPALGRREPKCGRGWWRREPMVAGVVVEKEAEKSQGL